MAPPDATPPGALRETVKLSEEVKAFGKTIGIEPTEALSRTTAEAPALSMLWLWLQRAGTLALRAPIDLRVAVGLAGVKEQARVEQVYRVDGYSIYYRQGNEFADPRALASAGFAAEGVVRRVNVILHEDLHGDKNFALPWEVEEGIVTPLGALAAVEFFRRQGDQENSAKALAALTEERQVARELSALLARADMIFSAFPREEAQKKVFDLMADYPTYRRRFQRQIQGQYPGMVLEAKLSHDAAYFRYFERIVALREKIADLAALITELKQIPAGTTLEQAEKRLEELGEKFAAPAK